MPKLYYVDENGQKTPIQFSAPTDVNPTADSDHLVTSGGTYQAIAAKADKVSAATAGNIPEFTSDGNIADSGHSIEDLAVYTAGYGIDITNNVISVSLADGNEVAY